MRYRCPIPLIEPGADPQVNYAKRHRLPLVPQAVAPAYDELSLLFRFRKQGYRTDGPNAGFVVAALGAGLRTET